MAKHTWWRESWGHSGQFYVRSLLSPFCPPPITPPSPKQHCALCKNPQPYNQCQEGPAAPSQLQRGSCCCASCGSHSRELERGKTSLEAGEGRDGCRAHQIGPLRGRTALIDPKPRAGEWWRHPLPMGRARVEGRQQHHRGHTHTKARRSTCFR